METIEGCIIEEVSGGLKVIIHPEMEFSKFGQLFYLQEVVSVTANLEKVKNNPEYGLNCIKIFDDKFSVKRTIIDDKIHFEACTLTAEDFECEEPLKDICSIGKKNVPDTKVEYLVLPESMMEISSGILKKIRNLKHVYVPNSVYCLSGIAFDECEKLEFVSIPEFVHNMCRDGIVAIKDQQTGFKTHVYGLFSNCPNLKDVEVRGECTQFQLTLDENGKTVYKPVFLLPYHMNRLYVGTGQIRVMALGYSYEAMHKLMQYPSIKGYCKAVMEQREINEQIAASYDVVIAKQKKTLCTYASDEYLLDYLIYKKLVDIKLLNNWIKAAEKKGSLDSNLKHSIEYMKEKLES